MSAHSSRGRNIVTLPESSAICTYHHGPHEQLSSALEKLTAYTDKNGLELSGACRYVFLEGPPHHKDKKLFITQVLVFMK